MEIGVTIRNMGAESTAELVLACALAAEARDIESLWITDHIAIPPDDAEGSGGRYLDTLTTHPGRRRPAPRPPTRARHWINTAHSALIA